MRYITTSGVERLNPIEFTGAPSGEPPKPLQPMVYPETRVPAYLEQPKELPMSDEELRSLQAQLGEMSAQEKEKSEQVQDDFDAAAQGQVMGPAISPVMSAAMGDGMNLMGQEQMMGMEPMGSMMGQEQMGPPMNQSIGSMMGQEQMMGPSMGQTQVPMPQVSQVQMMSPQQGGMPPLNPPLILQHPMENAEMYDSGIGSGPFIAIRTDDEAMAADGLLSGFSRAPRRAPYRNMGGMMQPAMPHYTPAAPAGANDMIRVTKLE
jgi:hypothetical protein